MSSRGLPAPAPKKLKTESKKSQKVEKDLKFLKKVEKELKFLLF